MLSVTEQDLVESKLAAVLARTPSPRATIIAFLRAELAILVPEGLPAVVITETVKLCMKDAYTQAPPQLVKLLENMLPNDDVIAQIVSRIRIPPPAAPDPFEARILGTKLPFLDRKLTRSALRALTQPQPAQPVVVINGDRRMGKSYTSEFIDHVSASLGSMQHCRVEVGAEQGASIGPRELARDLVTFVGGNLQAEPPLNTNLDRYAQELANWIINEASKGDERWWFVLDGFTKEELRDDTRQLIVKLANSLTTGVARRRHRLILLSFDRTVLLLQPGKIASETTTGIPRSAIDAVVSELVAASGKPLDGTTIAAKVADGFPDPVTDLPELNSRLRDLISVLEA